MAASFNCPSVDETSPQITVVHELLYLVHTLQPSIFLDRVYKGELRPTPAPGSSVRVPEQQLVCEELRMAMDMTSEPKSSGLNSFRGGWKLLEHCRVADFVSSLSVIRSILL